MLATLNPKAVDYLDNVGPETWCMFAIDTAGFKMHGMRTSNIVEAENARLLGARSMAPIAFLDETVRLEMKALSAARQQAATYVHNGQLLTGKAAKHDKMVTGQSQRCSVEDSDGNVFYITYEGAADRNRREVNLEQKTCGCQRWQQLLMPCFHAVRAARAAGRLQNTNAWYQHAYGQIYIAKNYLEAMRSASIKLPQLAGRTYKACTVGTSARPPSTQEDSLKGEYQRCESTQEAALQQMSRARPLREDVPQCTCKSTRVRLTTTLIRLTIAHATYQAGAPAPVV